MKSVAEVSTYLHPFGDIKQFTVKTIPTIVRTVVEGLALLYPLNNIEPSIQQTVLLPLYIVANGFPILGIFRITKQFILERNPSSVKNVTKPFVVNNPLLEKTDNILEITPKSVMNVTKRYV